MAEYVKNAELRELIIKFNATNIEDNGDWLPDYKKRMEKKYLAHKLKKEKYELAMEFVNARTQHNVAKFNYYNSLTPAEKQKYDADFTALRDKLWIIFKKIAEGRIASMRFA